MVLKLFFPHNPPTDSIGSCHTKNQDYQNNDTCQKEVSITLLHNQTVVNTGSGHCRKEV